MGFFDGKVEHGFDEMFDLNRDGKLTGVERAMQFDFLTRQSEKWNDDDFDDWD